jgi:hypothetical protein
MRVEVYRATDAVDVPGILFLTFDGLDDRYVAAFYNYPDTVKHVVVAWGTTGAVNGALAGEPTGFVGHHS